MEQENQKQTKKMSNKVKVTLGIIAIIVLVFAVKGIYHAIYFESTDNAQIDGNIIPLKTTVSGFVNEIRFNENQHVNKGDTLIVFDTVELSAQVQQAEAQLFAAKAGYSLGEQQITAGQFNRSSADFASNSAKVNIDAAAAKYQEAKNDFNRISNMLKKGAATQQQFDNASTMLKVAQAQLEATKNQYESSNAKKQTVGTQVDIYKLESKSNTARILQAEAQLEMAKDQYSHAFVTAPCNGIVSKKNVEVGQFAAAGFPLATIIDTKNIWVTANYKETQLNDMKIGQPVKITVDAYPELKLKGTVQSFCGATGAKFSILPSENATGNYIKVTQRVPVKITLKEKPEEKMLVPGMSVEASVKVK